MSETLAGRIALVTGVVGGIGAAIAQALAEAGATALVTDQPGNAFEHTRKKLGFPGIAADLGDRASVCSLTELIRADHGDPAILVNAAGGVCHQVHQPIEDISETDWRSIFAANVDSAFFLAQALAPSMREQGFGRIITISSGAGFRPSLTGIQAYTSAKHALIGLTRQLSAELGPHGITVNSIAPGFVLSNPATEKQWQSYGPDGQKKLLERLHTRRLGRPEDIAAAALFLSGDDASWITGQVISVDGGAG